MTYLDDVPDGKEFFLSDKKVKNLHGLLFELRTMSDDTYNYYVSSDHNYFSDWISNVINFKELAEELRNVLDRKEAINILEKNVEELKNPKKDTKEIINTTQEKKLDKDINEKKNINEETNLKEVYKKHHENQKENNNSEQSLESKKVLKKEEVLEDLIKHDAKYGKDFLWKHFAFEMAKEFMYGMAIGILIGFILSKIFLR